ncbi:unnamed protein product [Prorocentrum cordatum]|uniref:Uncharacterized protein n=1 Tax=Prorocentrum cordatum TaxID=2364126 RepID=A0ABN9RY20_9DINO|nr:unnamed protein product [Polarella glacialis]
MPVQNSHWSTCQKCKTWDWDDAVSRRQGRCGRCGTSVKLHAKTKHGDKGKDKRQDGSKLLDQGPAPAATNTNSKEGELLRTLITSLAAGAAPQQAAASAAQALLEHTQPSLTPEEQVKKTSGAWRDASLKHEQSVSMVLKCRENLARAEEREQQAAVTLAVAERARQAAAAAFSRQVSSPTSGGGGDPGAVFDLTWDESLFASVGQLEGIEQSEKDGLLKIAEELRQYKTRFAESGSVIKERLDQARKLHMQVTERLTKKRKQAADQAASGQPAPPPGGARQAGTSAGTPGGASAGATGAAGATGSAQAPTEPELKAAAEALSQKKFAEMQAKREDTTPLAGSIQQFRYVKSVSHSFGCVGYLFEGSRTYGRIIFVRIGSDASYLSLHRGCGGAGAGQPR